MPDQKSISNPAAFAEHHPGPEIPQQKSSRAVPIPETPVRGRPPSALGSGAAADAKFLVAEFGLRRAVTQRNPRTT